MKRFFCITRYVLEITKFRPFFMGKELCVSRPVLCGIISFDPAAAFNESFEVPAFMRAIFRLNQVNSHNDYFLAIEGKGYFTSDKERIHQIEFSGSVDYSYSLFGWSHNGTS